MARGGKSSRGSKGSQKKPARAPRAFDHGIPDPFDNPDLSEGPQNWADHYQHPVRKSFECQGCDKSYATLHHLTSHERDCYSRKRGLTSLLQESKVFWEARKRRRMGLERSQEVASNLTSQSDQNPESGVNDPPEGSSSVHPSSSEAIAVADEAEMDAASMQGLQGCSSVAVQPMTAGAGPEGFADLGVPVANRKPKRNTRKPARYEDNAMDQESSDSSEPSADEEDGAPPDGALASSESTLGAGESSSHQNAQQAHAADVEELPEGVGNPPGTTPRTLCSSRSKRNGFGVVRRYALPSGSSSTHNPEQALTLSQLTDTLRPVQGPSEGPVLRPYGPFKTKAAFSMADWYWNSTSKSFADFQKLIGIIKEPSFSVADIIDVNWRTLFKNLGANKDDLNDYDGRWISDDGWRSTPISIDVPFHNRMKGSSGTERYVLGNLRHRSIVAVIKEKIANARDSFDFHYHPYRATWMRNSESREVELYGEFYYSREFRSADEELQKLSLPGQPENMERVVVALMFWSDGTHLTSFGPASLWPCYLYFGNESKYRRSKPSENLGHHIAYFEKLPDVFTDYLKERNNGKIPSDALIKHCGREAYHSQWRILLDEELRDAMQHGIRLVCPDGETRLFFPRVFTYSADYPEKALVATMRNNGVSPCHRCLVAKCDLFKLGAPIDTERELPRPECEARSAVERAREEIFQGGYAVDTPKIEDILKKQSLLPTVNAFQSISNIQTGHHFSINDALVIDQMHEFEIGVWKRLYIHLIRLLHTFTTTATTLTAELDFRYRATPPFGRDTIRKFGVNASDMKRKAARDFEDLLQCAIPAFESLLPEPYNSSLMTLLYICAYWHALAKLRLHNDFTLECLEYATVRLGAQMRRFDRDIANVPTKELQKEADARARKEGKGKSKSGANRKLATLGIFTIKFHFLGDYVSSIRKRGTTDSYSTETGELAHRLPKSWYRRTDKREFKDQMTQIERRQARLSQIRSTIESSSAGQEPSSSGRPGDQGEPNSNRLYAIGASQNEPLDLSLFAVVPGSTNSDKHLTDFLPKLQQHLLPRIAEKLGFPCNAIAESDAALVSITDNRLFNHQILRLFYTTYDVRRVEDVIHVDTPQCNVMFLNSDYGERTWSTEHPYLYGKINGVFHANISFVGLLPDGTRDHSKHRLEFAWVHWYQLERSWSEFELDRVSLTPLEDSSALGFVDPADILRAVHVIPRFSKQRMTGKQRSRVVRNLEFWNEYYINRFADRDLFMRFQYGMSVGHRYMHGSTFPPPTIPEIPPDFDHCLPPPPERASAATSTTQGVEIPLPEATPSAPDPNSMETQELVQSCTALAANGLATQENSAMTSLDPTSPYPDLEGHVSENPASDQYFQEQEDEQSDEEEEEQGLYWDCFEDGELMHYDEMFGFGDED